MPGSVHETAGAAVAAVLVVAACGGESVATPSVEEPQREAPAVEPVLAPAPVLTSPAPAIMPVPDGPVFRLAYQQCPGTMQIAQAGDATYVYYDAPGVGRVDRLDSTGVRVAELDLVGPAPRPGCCSEPKLLRSGRWSPELPFGYLLDLAEADDGALYLAAAFHVHEQSWETRVFRRHGSRWRRVAGAEAQLLYPRAPGGLLGFGDEATMGFFSPAFVKIGGRTAAPELWPLVEYAVRAGAGAGTARGDPSSGFSVLSLDVERGGRVLAVLTYELDGGDGERVPVGTWLATWTGVEPAAIERIDDAPAERARVLGDGAGGAWVLLDGALQRWRDGSFARIELPPLDGSGAPILAGLDPQGRPWLHRGRDVAALAEASWRVEALPGDSPVDELAGVRFGTPWALRDDDTPWSRLSDGRWALSGFDPPKAPASAEVESRVRLAVLAADDAWLVSSTSGAQPDVFGLLPETSDVYTTRPLARPNPCR